MGFPKYDEDNREMCEERRRYKNLSYISAFYSLQKTSKETITLLQEGQLHNLNTITLSSSGL